MSDGSNLEVMADGLAFPEGPVAMADGSVVLVEIARQTLSRVLADGTVEVVAQMDGGPNGAAIGPDGRMYVCNNGGFNEQTDPTGHFAKLGMPKTYIGGSIQVVDLTTGKVETLYTECNGRPLSGPNDIVFDASGGFWFTDLGKSWDRHHDHGGLYYAQPDGSEIREVIYPLTTPNGVGLSPDGATLYAAETDTGRLFAWTLSGPGQLESQRGSRTRGQMMHRLPGTLRFDSLAVDSGGHVCIGTLGSGGGITDVAPDGTATLVDTGDFVTTNICFGGPHLGTAYITCSQTGTLKTMPWARPGHPLAFNI